MKNVLFVCLLDLLADVEFGYGYVYLYDSVMYFYREKVDVLYITY